MTDFNPTEAELWELASKRYGAAEVDKLRPCLSVNEAIAILFRRNEPRHKSVIFPLPHEA